MLCFDFLYYLHIKHRRYPPDHVTHVPSAASIMMNSERVGLVSEIRTPLIIMYGLFSHVFNSDTVYVKEQIL